MKTNWKVLFAAGLFITTMSFAQERGRLHLLIEGGPNYSTLRGNDIVERYHMPALAFLSGAGVQYSLSDLLSLRTQVMYERRSTLTEITVTDATGLAVGKVTHRYNWNYLTVPLLARLEFGENLRFFGQIGPYVSYLLEHNMDMLGASFAPPQANALLYNKLDLGVCAGLGVAAPVTGRISLSLEVRNTMGLTNISAVPVYNGGTLMSNSTALVFGLLFRPGKM